jgi:flagellar motility protein MotE (MotC chaperone)
MRESQGTLTAAVVRIAEIVEENEKRAEVRSRKVDERFAELAASQKTTDEKLRETADRLNALIHVLEDHVVRRRNGRKRRK